MKRYEFLTLYNKHKKLSYRRGTAQPTNVRRRLHNIINIVLKTCETVIQ